MTTWVVMKARAGSQLAWAWGKVVDPHFGFETIDYTAADGFSPVDLGDQAPQLIEHLFTVTTQPDPERLDTIKQRFAAGLNPTGRPATPVLETEADPPAQV